MIGIQWFLHQIPNFSLLTDNNYIREPYDYHKQNAEYVFLFSMGYFIYDLLDMYIHLELASSKEYLIHHSLVITAFSIILGTGRLFGLAMIALLVEVQTVFLHLRTMVRLAYGHRKQSDLMDSLINANMICLFVFRHLPVCYLLFYLLAQDEKVPILLKLFLVGGLSFLEYHNTHLTVSYRGKWTYLEGFWEKNDPENFEKLTGFWKIGFFLHFYVNWWKLIYLTDSHKNLPFFWKIDKFSKNFQIISFFFGKKNVSRIFEKNFFFRKDREIQ